MNEVCVQMRLLTSGEDHIYEVRAIQLEDQWHVGSNQMHE